MKALILALTFLLASCASLNGIFDKETKVTLLTYEVVKQSSNPAATAKRMRQIIGDARQYVLNPTNTLSTSAIEAYVRVEVAKLGLDPVEFIIVDKLIKAESADLEAKLGPIDNLFDSSKVTSFLDTLTMMENTLTMSGY